MKQKLIRLSQHYCAALARHLTQGPRASLAPALRLGRRAAALGLETLALAGIHEQALARLKLSSSKSVPTRRARRFFTEASSAIEATHRSVRQAKVNLEKVMSTLGRRTEELADSHRQLKKGVVRRKAMEVDFAKRGKRHRKRLAESLETRLRLRRLTHGVLAAQEDERKKISHQLQDEIAQTLLGINVRLLCLKQEARTSTVGFKNTIASTQKLVAKSAKSVRQAGRRMRGL
jgi:signal transduction histidine kinase